MALPDFSMRQLLEAGVHFGHQTHRWNPKMSPYIFGARNNIHIIDLSQTVPLLDRALKVVSDTVAGGGRVLFVGTKRQASEIIADAAGRSAQYFVNARWLGGMLTNWKTISNSISRLRRLDELLAGEAEGFTKKERLNLDRERRKLHRALGGIKEMGSTPDLLFVVDTNKEAIAIQEARRLGIPIIAIVDSNCDPDNIDHPIPGNDDAARAISLYCDLIAMAALDGIARQQGSMGIDIGASEEAPVEPALEQASAEEAGAEETKAEKESGSKGYVMPEGFSRDAGPTDSGDKLDIVEFSAFGEIHPTQVIFYARDNPGNPDIAIDRWIDKRLANFHAARPDGKRVTVHVDRDVLKKRKMTHADLPVVTKAADRATYKVEGAADAGKGKDGK